MKFNFGFVKLIVVVFLVGCVKSEWKIELGQNYSLYCMSATQIGIKRADIILIDSLLTIEESGSFIYGSKCVGHRETKCKPGFFALNKQSEKIMMFGDTAKQRDYLLGYLNGFKPAVSVYKFRAGERKPLWDK